MSDDTPIEPVTALKSRSAEIISRTRRTRRPVIITQNGKPTAVVQDFDSFEQQLQALLLLLAVAHGDRDYREGRVSSDRAANRHFRNRLTLLGRD